MRQWENLISRIHEVRVKLVTSSRIRCFVQLLGRFVREVILFIESRCWNTRINSIVRFYRGTLINLLEKNGNKL